MCSIFCTEISVRNYHCNFGNNPEVADLHSVTLLCHKTLWRAKRKHCIKEINSSDVLLLHISNTAKLITYLLWNKSTYLQSKFTRFHMAHDHINISVRNTTSSAYTTHNESSFRGNDSFKMLISLALTLHFPVKYLRINYLRGLFQNHVSIGWLKEYKIQDKTLLYGTITYICTLLLHTVAIHI
jgi:hypothetical protein